MYAGLDCIMTVRLHHALMEIIEQRHQTQLVEFDHKVLNVCAKMRERGFRVDLPYSLELADELRADEEQHKLRAASLGVANVNSNQQIIEALLQRGHELTERTEKGNIKVDKVVLAGLNDYLADEILGAKEAAKAFKSWVEPFLNSAHDWRPSSLQHQNGQRHLPPIGERPQHDEPAVRRLAYPSLPDPRRGQLHHRQRLRSGRVAHRGTPRPGAAHD
jgi:hypothetical protein